MHFNSLNISKFFAFGLLIFAVSASAQPNIDSQSQNFDGESLMISLASQDIEKRTAAHIYLTGITDATVGTHWCGYDRAKSVTIRSLVFDGLRSLSREERRKTAGQLVVAILSKQFPCKRKNDCPIYSYI